MHIIRTVAAMQEWALLRRCEGKRVGLVPTMGFLHEGHLSLVETLKSHADLIVVSIFVNPIQFGPNEDFDRYPRDEERDLALLEKAGADVVFLPSVPDMYPAGFQTHVEVERLPQHLCGLHRPGHFRGVATVVLKLFHACIPHVAAFGSKDYQQLQVIRRMVQDLSLPIAIIEGPTVRESDGLALSSRNSFLSPDERQRATCLVQALRQAKAMVQAGETSATVVRHAMADILEKAGARVDYIALVNPFDLEELELIGDSAHAAIAAYMGRTRLIDNMRLKG